jgi:tRNA 2-thiocytidine biosynthesis protein TtcA
MQNIVPSHLADNRLFNFQDLTLDTPVEEGDIAFDAPEMPTNTNMTISGTIPIMPSF